MENNRLRTIPNALKEIKKDDPNTCVTYALLKKLCEENLISHIKNGNRIILNYDGLLEYLFKGKDD